MVEHKSHPVTTQKCAKSAFLLQASALLLPALQYQTHANAFFTSPWKVGTSLGCEDKTRGIYL